MNKQSTPAWKFLLICGAIALLLTVAFVVCFVGVVEAQLGDKATGDPFADNGLGMGYIVFATIVFAIVSIFAIIEGIYLKGEPYPIPHALIIFSRVCIVLCILYILGTLMILFAHFTKGGYSAGLWGIFETIVDLFLAIDFVFLMIGFAKVKK